MVLIKSKHRNSWSFSQLSEGLLAEELIILLVNDYLPSTTFGLRGAQREEISRAFKFLV